MNVINPNHRHDEEHEQATDSKRTAIAESQRFESFAPVREGNRVKWYVDALDYLWAVSIALQNAKEVIYIEDWWLSPELFMRRPPFLNQEWRLDQILKHRAEAGVKIYVIVYKEVGLACGYVERVGEVLTSPGQPSLDLQLRSHQARPGEPLPPWEPGPRQYQGPAPSGSQHL